MFEAILFDLDDTLLGNCIETFIPHYFSLLGAYAERYMEKKRFLEEMMICTHAMMASKDTAVSNRDVFWQTFQKRNDLDPAELEPFFDQFYRQQFPQLKKYTQRKKIAAELVADCLERGIQVVVATNPVFPRIAIEERLRWAGVPVERFNYDLVTTYENSYSTKPQLAYYEHILQTIGCLPEKALMVGNDWEQDIEPAIAANLSAYWITDGNEPPDERMIMGHGDLAQFYEELRAS